MPCMLWEAIEEMLSIPKKRNIFFGKLKSELNVLEQSLMFGMLVIFLIQALNSITHNTKSPK